MLYPIITGSRMVMDLSGIWDFALDNGKGFEEKWYERPLEKPITMPVPASYNDLKEGAAFRDHYGWVFYQRNISVPRAVINTQRVVLRCDAVTHHGIVYLNGKELIRHEGGFLPFEVEIGDELHEGDSVSLDYSIDIAKDMVSNKDECGCRLEIFDEHGKKVAECQGEKGHVDIENIHLWQPLNSYLYNIKVTCGEDVYVLPYGFRSVEVKGSQFLINGKPFYFKGYGKHEDTYPSGRGINIPMYIKDISLMKWQGANSFRCSHYPYSEEMMRIADREGFVVIDETTAVGINFDFGGGANFGGQKVGTYDREHGVKTFDHHMDVLRDLIERDRNYACVVMWNIANEPDSYSEGAYEYFEPLYKLAKELDPEKRPCTLTSVQMAGGPDTDISAKLSDVICLNRYYGWYYGGPDLEGAEVALRKELDEWKKLGKPLMFTEYGADTVMGFHDTTPVMYTEEYQVDYYKMNNKVFDEYDFVVGEHVWNFADFATSQSLLRVQGNKKGLFTRDRKPKLAAHYFKDRWMSIPDYDYKK